MFLTFPLPLPDGGGLVTLEIYKEDDRLICGIYQIEGRLKQPPKQWLRTMRAILKDIETVVRNAGCSEIRVAGRNWQRILTDYEPMPGIENRLRKGL